MKKNITYSFKTEFDQLSVNTDITRYYKSLDVTHYVLRDFSRIYILLNHDKLPCNLYL